MIVRRALAGLAVGTLFGAGLAVSQMTNALKVLAFLNLSGNWDPSLLLVILAATSVTFFGYRWATNKAPLFEEKHYLPTARDIDVRLVIGAVIFGVGWGLAGYCPGPAITGLGSGSAEPIIFVAAMVVGSQIARWVQDRKRTGNPRGSSVAGTT